VVSFVWSDYVTSNFLLCTDVHVSRTALPQNQGRRQGYLSSKSLSRGIIC